MSQQKTQTVVDELSRAAELIDQLNLLRTLDDIPCERMPRTVSQHSKSSVRATFSADMVLNAEIAPGDAYQPLVYAGGVPLVVDEPCVIMRQHPTATNE